MLTAVLGLTGALIFGSADFLGGLAAKRLSSLLVTAVAAASGLVALLLALPFVAGVWSPSAGEAMRFKRQIGAAGLKVFYNVVPEFGSALGTRTVAQRAKSAVVSSLADLILVSGPMAGEQPSIQTIQEVKSLIPDFPVFLNTGAKADNVVDFLKVADGVIVGSSLKQNGYTWNPVDPDRVQAFMDRVRESRKA